MAIVLVQSRPLSVPYPHPPVGDAILIVLGLMRAHIGIVTISMSIGKLARYAILVAATLGIISLF